MRFHAGLLLLPLLLTGCGLINYEETTTVRVQRPALVDVSAATPHGSEWILRDKDLRAEVPNSKPPLTEGGKFATVERTRGGGISVDCPSCAGTHPGPIVGSEISLDGDANKILRWEPDGSLGMRYSYSALFPCYRGGGLCPREAFALWLSTPRENVTEVRYRKVVATRYGERSGAKLSIFFGLVFGIAGAVIIPAVSISNGHFSSPAAAVGIPFMALGGFFTTVGVLALTAKDSETRIFPSR